MKRTAVLARQSGSPAPKHATSWPSYVQFNSHGLSGGGLCRLELPAWGYELQLSDAQTQEHEP
jgi:hypothetical protein